MAEPEINAFLTHLATKEKVSASTQNQALSALLFLYRHVLGREVGDLGEVIRARKPKRLPVVMTRDEVKAVLTNLTGDKWLMASLMYGAGLRLMECLRLRVQDIDFSRNEILVRDGKGAKDRITMLPESLKAPLQQHLKTVKAIHERDLADGWGRVHLPDALDRKYPQRSQGVALAMDLSAGEPLEKPKDGRRGTPSRSRIDHPEGGQRRGEKGRLGQTGHLPHIPSFLRHATPGIGLRHQDSSGTSRSQGRQDYDDLHPCPEPGRQGR
jgi:hypothetical protein